MAGVSRITVEQVLEMLSGDEMDVCMDVEVGNDDDSNVDSDNESERSEDVLDELVSSECDEDEDNSDEDDDVGSQA